MPSEEAHGSPRRVIGRYVLHDEIASGGMATVHLGRLLGAVGFSRTVAIKVLHAQYAKDPEFVAMFLDEARLAGRIRHPNVVSTLDVVALGQELFLVMDFIEGETLSRLLRRNDGRRRSMPLDVASSVLVDALDGLHAAHEAKGERGEPLCIVHRDVSPQNLIVGRDGVTRVLDFGVAKAALRVQTTRDGAVKGKFAYMAPEQVARQPLDRRVDVFAASIVLWETLTGKRLFAADDPAATVVRVMNDRIQAPSEIVEGIPAELDALVLRGLSRDPDRRFATANEMARALERIVPPARPAKVGAWVSEVAGETLTRRAARVAQIESDSAVLPVEAASTTAPTATVSPALVDEPSRSTNVTTIPPPDGFRRRRTWIAAPLIAVAAVGVYFVTRSPHAKSDPPPAATSSTAESASAQTSTATVAPPPSASTSADPVPSSAPHPVPTTVAKPYKPPTAKPKTTVAPKPTPGADCTPPYTFDADGVKHFKKGCL